MHKTKFFSSSYSCHPTISIEKLCLLEPISLHCDEFSGEIEFEKLFPFEAALGQPSLTQFFFMAHSAKLLSWPFLRNSNKIYCEPLLHALSPRKDPIESFPNFT